MTLFTHCITAKDAQSTVVDCVRSLTHDPEAHVIIVDASDPPMTVAMPHLRMEPLPGCTKGAGRNRAVQLAETDIVFTHIDADNRYHTTRWPMFREAYEYLRRAPARTMLLGVGRDDKNPGATHFFGWHRQALLDLGGYPDRQFQDDILLILKVFRAGWSVHRMIFPSVADDLQARAPGSAGQTAGRASRAHFTKAIRKFRHLGFTYGECARFQWVTRRTPVRFLAALGVITWVYLGRRQTPDEFLTAVDTDAAGLS